MEVDARAEILQASNQTPGDLRSVQLVQVMWRRTLGALDFGSLSEDAYTRNDVEFMGRVARLVAVAVENAMSLETAREQQAALQRERDQLDLLLDVTNAVVTQLDTRALFAAVAPALRRCSSADVAALSLIDPEARVLRHQACDAPADFCLSSEPPQTVERSLKSPVGLVFHGGQASNLLAVGAGDVSRRRLHSGARHSLDLAARVPSARTRL